MQKFLKFLLVLTIFSFVSCSSSHSSNDSDIIPDADTASLTDSDDLTAIEDAENDSQDSDFIDDSDEEIPDESSSVVDRYKRCYDKIPDEPYEGFFANPHIESEVKRSLGYEQNYKLKEEDLEKVTKITIYSQDLRGIEKLVNLKKIQISGENVYDFTPLLSLKQLKEVILSSEYMTCLDGSFSLLTNLETLEITETNLKDVSPIEQLVNLITLKVSDNRIEFLPENLCNLQKLEYLALSYNNVKNIEPVESLTRLKELYFHYNYIEDISPVKNLINLTSLGAQSNQIKDISLVAKLVNLTWLGLNRNQIEEIPKEIMNLKKLRTFELDYNNISNLPDLQGLDSLSELWLAFNKLNNEDFSKLDKLETVGFLDLSFNKITKVPVMKNVKSLYELLLTGNNINDLSGFADNESFPALRRLDVGSNKIENVEAFRKREGLSILRIDKNCIKDFSPLEELMERGTHVGGINQQLESCEGD